MASRFTELIVDAHDPQTLARFWCATLGWAITDSEDGVVEIADSLGSRPTLVFVPVSEAKTLKNRLHIDVSPVGCTQAEEVERLLELGARHHDVGQGEQSWVVLADVEGNEFCVLGTPVDVD